MKSNVLQLKALLVCVLLLMSISIIAETKQQQKVTTKLKAIFGLDSKIEFLNDFDIVSKIKGSITDFNVSDSVESKKVSDKLLRKIKTYMHVTMNQIESVNIDSDKYNLQNSVVVYNQKNIWGIDFEKTPSITFTFYESGKVHIENNFICNFVLPERPFITKEQAIDFAKSEFIKQSKKHSQSDSIIDDENINFNQQIRDMGLYICKFQKGRNVVYYKAAYRIMMDSTRRLSTIYIDAKNGNVLSSIMGYSVN